MSLQNPLVSSNGNQKTAQDLADHEYRIRILERGGGATFVGGAVDLSPFVRKDTLQSTGSIYVRNAFGTVVELPVGTDGQVLVADSTVPEGVSWQDSPGVGAFPTYSVTSFTTTHSYIATATTINEFANVLATVIAEWVASAALGSYTVTGASTDRTFDPASTSLNEMANILATCITDLSTAGPSPTWTIGTYTPTRGYDATATTLNQLANTLATFLSDLISRSLL